MSLTELSLLLFFCRFNVRLRLKQKNAPVCWWMRSRWKKWSRAEGERVLVEEAAEQQQKTISVCMLNHPRQSPETLRDLRESHLLLSEPPKERESERTSEGAERKMNYRFLCFPPISSSELWGQDGHVDLWGRQSSQTKTGRHRRRRQLLLHNNCTFLKQRPTSVITQSPTEGGETPTT